MGRGRTALLLCLTTVMLSVISRGAGPALPDLTGADVLIMQTEQEGMHRITWSYLTNGISPATLQTWSMDELVIMHRGAEVAIHRSKDTGSFGTNDYVVFFATNLYNRFTDQNVYWLYHTTNAVTAKTYTLTGETGGTAITNQLHTHHHELNEYYEPRLYDESPDDEHFFFTDYLEGDPLFDFTNDVDLTPSLNNVSGIDTTAVIRAGLIWSMESQDNSDNTVTIDIDGTDLTNMFVWTGSTQKVIEASVDQTNLVSGVNTIGLNIFSDDYKVILIDWLEIDYLRDLTAVSNALTFASLAGTNSYSVTGFQTSTIEVYQVSGPETASVITNAVISGSGPYTATFSASGNGDMLSAVTPEGMYMPASLRAYTNANLKSATNSADYLIIAHPDLITAVQPLADYRASKGHSVRTINVQDIYDEFNEGVLSPYAIRDFLGYARANWTAPLPKYLLLIGDGTYDYRDDEGEAIKNFVPTKFVHDEDSMEAPSDIWYGCLDGDLDIQPDMFVGRFAVQTTGEVSDVINKTIFYETNLVPPTATNILWIADNANAPSTNYFEDFATSSINTYLPTGYIATGYSRNTSSDAQINTAIISNLNDGVLIALYAGHGNERVWVNNTLFQKSDIASLTNYSNMPLVITPTCRGGYFVNPSTSWEGMGELFLRSSSGGAAACISPSGQSNSDMQKTLVDSFMDSLFLTGTFEVGKALTYAMNMTYNELGGAASNIIHTTVYFGDPALKLNQWSGYEVPAVYSGGNTNDSDHDGMPDGWEIVNALDPISTNDAALDGDFDNVPNLGEYIAGTSPTNGSDYFLISGVSEPQAGSISATFNSFAGREYILQETTNILDQGSWMNILTNSGIDGTMVITNIPTSNNSFYRISVRME